MIQEHQIPLEWRELLEKFQTIHSKIVLAGGALRDLDNLRPVKDFDFFIGCGTDKEALALNERLGGEPVTSFDSDVWYPESMNEIILVSDKIVEGLPPVQFIFVNYQVHRIYDRFDYGLSQIMFDGHKIYRSDQYMLDCEQKKFTLLRADSNSALEASVNRFGRLSKKYSDYEWRYGLESPFSSIG